MAFGKSLRHKQHYNYDFNFTSWSFLVSKEVILELAIELEVFKYIPLKIHTAKEICFIVTVLECLTKIYF